MRMVIHRHDPDFSLALTAGDGSMNRIALYTGKAYRMKELTQSSMLKGSGAAQSFGSLFGYSAMSAQGSDDDVPTILNLAATAETLACTHYYAAITSGGIAFDDKEMAYLKAA